MTQQKYHFIRFTSGRLAHMDQIIYPLLCFIIFNAAIFKS